MLAIIIFFTTRPLLLHPLKIGHQKLRGGFEVLCTAITVVIGTGFALQIIRV
ncbi:Uncharacterised protein [Vibrio cholerae]|uniref:Uncharacterized protein n=1 Tax=Vibrio cholerae TaxID=666 RepID=A0A655ZD14_VIBCL|nr:Uncharacterised protein [Vibrio cholerae]CSC65937.1 Uncharacterised protein [Vibrio cholerae]